DSWTAASSVLGLVAWDDGLGGGTQLYAVGDFTTPGTRFAVYDGTTWGTVGAGTNNRTRKARVWDDGAGEALFICGAFTNPGNRIGGWDGSSLFSLTASGETANGVNGEVYDILPTTLLGSGSNALVLGGQFSTMGDGTSAARVGYWDPASMGSWNAMGDGFNNDVHALIEFDGSIYAGGEFTADGNTGSTTLNRVARWNGTAWVAVGDGFDGDVTHFVIYDSRLYAIGRFDMSGSLTMVGVARLNEAGTAWEALIDEDFAGIWTQEVNGSPANSKGGAGAVYNSQLYIIGEAEGAGGAEVGFVCEAAREASA
ncbi:MAG TPA: hypothetical protein VJ925_10110, partial [Longimicrobiales bacterium]|nr:hypothetical protein [Longimicrobiales bacterium]